MTGEFQFRPVLEVGDYRVRPGIVSSVDLQVLRTKVVELVPEGISEFKFLLVFTRQIISDFSGFHPPTDEEKEKCKQ